MVSITDRNTAAIGFRGAGVILPLLGVVLSSALLWDIARGESAKGSATGKPEPQAAPPVLAATVGGEPIYVHQVERQLESALRGRPVDSAGLPLLQAAALEQLIGRQLILSWLKRSGQAASARDVDFEIHRLERSLERHGVTLAEYCRRQNLDEEHLRQALLWQLSWQRFLDRYLTEENLQRYFERNRREWDGSRLRVAHILLKVDVTDSEKLAATRAKAEEIREEIVTGKKSFADAAKEYSEAPSTGQGGDLGFISRREPMPEGFSKAAYRLQPQGVSPPVISIFGVHLVTCLEVEAGQRTVNDVRPELAQAVTQYLFEWAAERQRGQVSIDYSGAIAALPAGLAPEFLGADESRK